MKNLALLFAIVVLASGICIAQTSAFTYQGKLGSSGSPASGVYQFEFKLFPEDIAGTQIGSTQTVVATVQNGVFTTRLDFGAAAFPGDASRWLEISVRLNGSGDPYTVLSPRQEINSVPFAVHSRKATSADNAENATNAATATTAGNVTGVVQIGNGGTGSATQNFVDLTTNQTIGGRKTFTDPISGDGSGLTNVNAALADGSITTAKLADGSVTRAKLAFDFRNGFDPQLVALLRWDQLPVVPNSVDVGRDPSALAFDGTFMYVANKLDNNVMRISTRTGLIEGNPIQVGTAPSALAYDGTFINVANSGSNTVSRIRASNGLVEGSPIVVGANPQALAFDGTFIYVANFGGDSVTRIRASNGAIHGGPIAVSANPHSLAFGGGFVYVSHRGDPGTGAADVKRINVATGAVLGIDGLPIAFPGALAFDGTFIYVTSMLVSSAQVTRIRASTGVIETNPIRSDGINGKALAFDGTFLYGSGHENVHRLSINALRIHGSPLPIFGSNVTALAFDGAYLYAATERIFTDPNTGLTSQVNGAVTRF